MCSVYRVLVYILLWFGLLCFKNVTRTYAYKVACNVREFVVLVLQQLNIQKSGVSGSITSPYRSFFSPNGLEFVVPKPIPVLYMGVV